MHQVNGGDSLDLTIEVLGYRMDDSGYNNPMGDILAARVLQAPRHLADLDVFQVKMKEPDGPNWNGNRLIRDLINGTEQFGVQACGVGSVLVLRGFEQDAEGNCTTSLYTILETRDTAQLDEYPDPSKLFEGEWVRPVVGGEYPTYTVPMFAA
jgi:hypothetical protein